MRFLFLALIAVACVAFAACGDDDENDSTTTSATTSGSPTVVSVRLQDYSIVPTPTSGSAGSYEFAISNSGPSTHEFVLVKTDLQADALPTDADGAVIEDDPDLTAIDEVEDIEPNGTGKFLRSLTPGHYAYFCNIVEEGGGGAISHYVEGMHGDFIVQ